MGREALVTEAIVLRAIPYGEADLILTLYTRARGRLSALARAARKSKRRFSGALDMFTLSSLQLRGHASGDLWTLQAAQPVRAFASLALDMGAFAHASYGTELLRELSPAEVPDEPALDLLLALFAQLEAHGPHAQVLRAFELALLDVLGLAPVLDRCVGCGTTELDGRGMLLDPGRGGVCCASCAALARQSGVRPLSGPARQALARAQAALDLAAACTLAPEAAVAAEARDAMLALLLGHVGKPLRSLEFIAKVSGAARARRDQASEPGLPDESPDQSPGQPGDEDAP
ncbi:MAG TPA: DNA repair protein RecO [Haliangium sp.]|nr:DNA repair protein RecO [Haliangium sp.]